MRDWTTGHAPPPAQRPTRTITFTHNANSEQIAEQLSEEIKKLPRPKDGKPTVVIAGAGLAGLSTAKYLCDAGACVLVGLVICRDCGLIRWHLWGDATHPVTESKQ